MSPSGRESVDPRYASNPFGSGGLSDRSTSLDTILSIVERREILRALQRSGGRRTLAARMLGISRSRLYRRMDALDIAFDEPADGHA